MACAGALLLGALAVAGTSTASPNIPTVGVSVPDDGCGPWVPGQPDPVCDPPDDGQDWPVQMYPPESGDSAVTARVVNEDEEQWHDGTEQR